MMAFLDYFGKTLRRSFKKGDRKSALHLISVWSDANPLVLGQFKSKDKKNEINTVMEWLELIDIQGATVGFQIWNDPEMDC